MWSHLFLAVLLAAALSACATGTRASSTVTDVQVRLAAADPAHLRVLVMGDQGKGGAVQPAVAHAMRSVCAGLGCDLGAGLGDNIYPRPPRDPADPTFTRLFAELYGPLGIPFLMAAGNHDESWLLGGDGADPAALASELAYARRNPQWVMPARTYRAQWADLAEFFVVDTTPLAAYLPVRDPQFRPGSAFDLGQRAWLDTSLRASTARWTIVLGHHPLLSGGRHGNAGAYDGGLLPWGRGDAVRALYGSACGRADLLASGHDHSLQLYPATTAACPGTTLMVSGAAGENAGQGQGNAQAQYQNYTQPGFFWMDLTRERLEVRAYTVDAAGEATLAYTTAVQKP